MGNKVFASTSEKAQKVLVCTTLRRAKPVPNRFEIKYGLLCGLLLQ